MTVAKGGQLVKFKDTSRPPRRRPSDKPRGKCRGFTHGSRHRMMQAVNAVDQTKVVGCIWLTMTAPGMKWGEVERYRRAWLMRFERKYRDRRWSMMWRKEAHPGTGANAGLPHLHVLIPFLDGEASILEFRAWNDQAWAEVVGQPDIADSCCSSEWIRTWRGAAFYTAKYSAKVEEGPEVEGRQWGIVRRQNWPVTLQDTAISKPVAILVQRQLTRLLRSRSRQSLQVWCPLGFTGAGMREDGYSEARWISMRHLDKICSRFHMTGREYLQGQDSLVKWEERVTGNKRPRDDYYRIRAGRAKFTRREVVNVWADQTDSWKPGRRELVHLGQETITHHRSAVYVRDTTVDQLVKWATVEHLRRLEEAEGLPF